jgi:creatinine amidohydrolase
MKMRTRLYDSMTNAEVTDYLARGDVVFLPVGTAEMHGSMPLACEHVLPLAIALRMAELADGLVLPGLVYFYPGATAVARGTIQVSPSVGAAYLKEICRSLLRQGFRRQVLLSFHGPAEVTLMPVVREFFDETRCSIVYLDLDGHTSRDLSWEQFNKMLWGAYEILGRLDEIPSEPGPEKRTQPSGLLRRFYYGYYYEQPSDHGWWPQKILTPEERAARAAEGVGMIDALVAEIDPVALVAGLREMDEYVKRNVLPRHGSHLP